MNWKPSFSRIDAMDAPTEIAELASSTVDLLSALAPSVYEDYLAVGKALQKSKIEMVNIVRANKINLIYKDAWLMDCMDIGEMAHAEVTAASDGGS